METAAVRLIFIFAYLMLQGLGLRLCSRGLFNSRPLFSVLKPVDLMVNQVRPKKYIVVTGGVISGIGKGVTASSIGVVLKMLSQKPTAIKIDPYLNIDAGTMSPFEHGETFVLDDGAETDLDLGNYERFLNVKLTHDSNLTTGKVYQAVILKERKGEFLGKTVQIIPHITNEIMERIISVAKQPVDEEIDGAEPDICVIELGGTIGDIESMPFVEALRQLQLLVKPQNFCLVHVSMVPMVGDGGEQKTKPTQHSVKELRAMGLAPDFIVCRAKSPVDISSRSKISMFCNLPVERVLSIHDLPNIYHVPLLLVQQNFHTLLSDKLGLPAAAVEALDDDINNSDQQQQQQPAHGVKQHTAKVQGFASKWRSLVERIDHAEDEAIIALVGKYTSQPDSYLSVISSLRHSCIATQQRLKLVMVESSLLEDERTCRELGQPFDEKLYTESWEKLRSAEGVLVPGGFGSRGIEGKIQAITFARQNKVPFLGICLGMQAAVIEFARHELAIVKANSREIVPDASDEESAIIFMPEGDKEKMGGTMRLGSRRTLLSAGSQAQELYSVASWWAEQEGQERGVNKLEHDSKSPATFADERHRHRYEVNPNLVDRLEAKGLLFSGRDETNTRMEIVELGRDKEHPYFIGVQFHPEFKSRPQKPAPVVLGLLQAVKDRRKSKAA